MMIRMWPPYVRCAQWVDAWTIRGNAPAAPGAARASNRPRRPLGRVPRRQLPSGARRARWRMRGLKSIEVLHEARHQVGELREEDTAHVGGIQQVRIKMRVARV